MNLHFRNAVEADLAAIIAMLADDALGATRENLRTPLPDSYQQAFAVIDRDPHQELTVVELDGEIVATFQLSFIQYLTYQGGIRAQIEAVRVKPDIREKALARPCFSTSFNAPSQKVHICSS